MCMPNPLSGVPRTSLWSFFQEKIVGLESLVACVEGLFKNLIPRSHTSYIFTYRLPNMADEVYEGAIGIDLGWQSVVPSV